MLSSCFLLSIAFCPPSYSSFLQLDANLVEGEPNNRFTQKINTTKSGATNFKYLEIVVTCQNEWHQCGAQSGVVKHRFFLHPPTHPVGQKTSLVNFKHYTDGIGTGYMSHDKEI